MKSCMWKLVVGFRSYGLIRLLGPCGPNVVSRPQTPKSRIFLKNHGFSGFVLWFWKKWGPVCENWSYGSGLTAWYMFWQRLADPHSFDIENFFMSSVIKFCMKQALNLKFYVTFDKVMSVFSYKMVKKSIKILLFGAIPDMKVSPKSCLKIAPFLAR